MFFYKTNMDFKNERQKLIQKATNRHNFYHTYNVRRKYPFSLDKKTIVNIIYVEKGRRSCMIDTDETGRYKKRTDSDVSKSKNKSKHKHQYADVLISVGPSNSLYTGRICTVCGKIRDYGLATDRIEIDGKICCRLLTDEETREKYKDLKEYHIDNLLQKYVKLEEHDGTVN